MDGIIAFLLANIGISIFLLLAFITLIILIIKRYFEMARNIRLLQQDVSQIEETLYKSYQVQKAIADKFQCTTELERISEDSEK